jgi:threonine synthase
MRFVSTRGGSPAVTLSQALLDGTAPDGGLYVPERWPSFQVADFDGRNALPEVAEALLRPFFAGDTLSFELGAICSEAFDFPAPLVRLPGADEVSVLELFHGPTAAFKDFGARFLAACLARLRRGSARRLHILVATSGDTGGAVAAALHRRPGLGVTVLFPRGLVSPAQRHQLTCWGDNVSAFEVAGTFDDCQRLVKQAFADRALRAALDLSSANSINVGRLLPQAAYYAATSLAIWRSLGRRASFVIPSGNLGNAVACVWARHLGLPIGDILLAHNANRTVPEFLDGGAWQPRASVATLASAMDVGDPSNMERARHLFANDDALRGAVSAESVDDATIAARIGADHSRLGGVWCPHTATAAEAWTRLPAARRAAEPWVIVATAHPAKFPEIVEPLIGERIELPSSLAQLAGRETHVQPLAADYAALREALIAMTKEGAPP